MRCLLRFQSFKIGPRASDDIARNTCQRGNLETVTLIRRSSLDRVQEDKIAIVFCRIEVHVAASRESPRRAPSARSSALRTA